jgi:serine/threonine protein kinase
MPAGPDLLAALTLSLGPAYIIDRELDGDGASWVFVAHEESTDRDVVVKVLAPELTIGVLPERFEREMQLVMQLNEPHTVPVLSYGRTATGFYYYTMPYVRGISLRHRIDEGPIAFD